jgi:hypothetical protein
MLYSSSASIRGYRIKDAAVSGCESPPDGYDPSVETEAVEPGAMCYMMSREGYGGDSVDH